MRSEPPQHTSARQGKIVLCTYEEINWEQNAEMRERQFKSSLGKTLQTRFTLNRCDALTFFMSECPSDSIIGLFDLFVYASRI